MRYGINILVVLHCYTKEGTNTSIVNATKEEKKLLRKARLRKLLNSIRKLLNGIYTKTISGCIWLLHFFAYDVGADTTSIKKLPLATAICAPVLIAIISGYILDQSNLGAWLVLISVAYKFWLSEVEYSLYQKQFAINEKKPKPPANPHQTARGMFAFAAPLMFAYFALHYIYPEAVSMAGAKLSMGFVLLMLSFWQDLSAGLACVFEAEYPKNKIQHGKYTGD